MDDSKVMGLLQRSANIDTDIDDPFPGQSLDILEMLLQTLPTHVFHRVKQMSLLFAVANQLNNVGMIQTLERFHLGRKSSSKPFLIGQNRGDDFDGDFLVRFGVNPFVDRPIPPRPKVLSMR